MSFTKVLVANRGEIALRILKACRKLNLKTVAVYSEADRFAPFTQIADQAVCLGASEARQSYLDIDKIIAAAHKTGAEAIHPGYGFLAENAEFARRCESAGLIFIGPSANVIEIMGSKIAAKNMAIEAAVPVVPGYQSHNQSVETLKSEAHRIGVPLMIKASAGGGGRGMRLVTALDDFTKELSLAQQEAKAAFGDASILLEKYIPNARHIEVQVLGDAFGNIVHLFERDCSIQRNHQKIIEEAPAPNLPETVRQSMFAAAIELATRANYVSAGTVEFIYDKNNGDFYFLEMNTRLQVEHPVTEAITGIDLVEWQLRIASGEALTLVQDDIKLNGWAIEVRLAAEDPAQNYMPQTGQITAYDEPKIAGVRIDSGIKSGSLVSHYYDSMLAKIIAHGSNRNAARRKLESALAHLIIDGVETNLSFLLDVLQLPQFVAGDHSTATLNDAYPKGWHLPALTDQQIAIAALGKFLNTNSSKPSGPWHRSGNWRITDLCDKPGATYFYRIDSEGQAQPIRILGGAASVSVFLKEKPVLVAENVNLQKGKLSFEVKGLRETARYQALGNDIIVNFAVHPYKVCFLPPEAVFLNRAQTAGAGGNQIFAPMPGLIVEVMGVPGQAVLQGETLIILEAMKLMQKLTAPIDGIITSVNFDVGDTPEKGAVLITIEPNAS